MSMIQTRNLMPLYVTENSRDIHTFLRLMDLVFNGEKLKSEDFISILNPDKCPNDLLPLLASYLGYDYDYNETFDRNRIIIRSYKNMMRNKGNVTGVRLAVSVAISMLATKSVTEAQSLFDVAYYDKYYVCGNCGFISYESFDECPKCDKLNTAIENNVGSIVVVIEYPKYSTKSYDLIEAVRPAGSSLKIYNGTIEEISETIGLSDFVKIQSAYLNLGNSEVGGKDSVVGFTPIVTESLNAFPTTNFAYWGTYSGEIPPWELLYEVPQDFTEYDDNATYLKDAVVKSNDSYYKCKIESVSGVDPDTSHYAVYRDDIEYLENDIIKYDNHYYICTVESVKGVVPRPPVYKYCENCHKLLLVNTDTESCPLCQSNDFKPENNSSLRYLYRMYNTNNELDNIIKAINEGNVLDNTDEIGVVLRINVSNFDKEPQTGKFEWYSVNNLKQSFVFSLKPYIYKYTDEGVEKYACEHTISEILNKLVTMNNTNLSTLRNKEKSRYSYSFVKDGEYYSIRVRDESQDGETEIINTHYYHLNSVKLGKIENGDVVFTDINDYYNSEQESHQFLLGKDNVTVICYDDCKAYDIGEIVFYNDSYWECTVKTQGVQYEFAKNEIYNSNLIYCKLVNGLYVITDMSNYEDGDIITDDVYIKIPEPFDVSKWQEYENKYSIDDYTTFRFKTSNYESAVDTEYDGNITYYTKSGNIYTEANMSGYTDGDIITDDVYINIVIPSKLSENNHMTDYNGKYLCLCKSCNNYFVVGKDDYLTCPYCAGVYTEILGNKIVDNTDYTTVVGSYMLDLYFR